MSVLLDSCVWGGGREILTSAGHEVEWVGDWPAEPGDVEILAHTAETRSVVITLDKDFGKLAIIRAHRHAGIVRIVGYRVKRPDFPGGSVCWILRLPVA